MKTYYSIIVLNSKKSWAQFASGFQTFEDAAIEAIYQAKKPYFRNLRNNPIKIVKVYNYDRHYLDETVVFRGRVNELPQKIKEYNED